MSTECYEMVRGSAIRITGLKKCGSLLDPIQYATSKSVIRVQINEVVEAGGNELIRDEQDEPQLHFVNPDEMIRYTADIDFIRCDPGVLNLVTGVPLVPGYGGVEVGFGEGPFGEMPFGEGYGEAGNTVGFDADTRIPPQAFGLEVWSKLARQACVDGERQWGYTLFPFLKGGRLSGFQFSNGLVSFSLRGAQARRKGKWNYGPYDLTGQYERLLTPVSGNTMFRSFIASIPPPEQMDGIQEFVDVIDGGSASFTTDDILDGEFVVTSPYVIEGGYAE